MGLKSSWGLTAAMPSVLAATLLVASAGASAAIVESAKVVKNVGKYSPKGFFQGPLTQTTGDQSLILGTTPGFANELGVGVTASASGGSFFFKNSLWRIGTGSATYETSVETTLTNTGPSSVTMNFDSLITPGYLAVGGPAGSSNVALFHFQISQLTDGVLTPLYLADGLGSPGALPVITTSAGSFTNLLSFSNTDTFAWTWDATNVSLLLNPIAAGSSSTIVYDLTTTIYGTGLGSGCEGSQVSFGDPRGNGGGSARAVPSVAPCSLEPIIGKRFDPYTVPFTFTVVPEPASWAMLCAGFAVMGGAMRRRRTTAVAIVTA